MALDDPTATAEFHRFFESHRAELARLAHLLTGEAGEADDLAADALLALWHRWDRVRRTDHPLAYARGVVANLARNRIRRTVRERHRAALLRPARADRVDNPDVAAVIDVRAALRRLPFRKRACVVLRHALDLSEKDTALALGVSVGTVKSQTSKGMAELARLLGDRATGTRRAPPLPGRYGTDRASPSSGAGTVTAVADVVDVAGRSGLCSSVSADGRLVWAHVRGPLSGDGDPAEYEELWAVLDATSGRVVGRVNTMTVASSSEHTSHPDPTQMGLSIGEGEEGSPALWGRWDGRQLTVEQLGIEQILLAVSPSGRLLLTVDVGQWTLSLHRAEDGSKVLRELDAADSVPAHPRSTGDDRVYWDYEAAFVDEDTLVAGTSECDARYGSARHWLVDVGEMTLRGEISCPAPVRGPARAAGAGTWYTISEDGASVQLWELAAFRAAAASR